MSEFDRLFSSLESYFGDWHNARNSCRSAVRYQRGSDGITVEIDLPGFSRKDIKVISERGILSIEAQKGDERFRRTYTIDDFLDVKKAKAKMEHGRFTLSIPYKDAEGVEIAVE